MTRGTNDPIAITLDSVVVRGERNLLAETAAPGIEGARAALDTFYYAFNTRSVDLLRQIWEDDPLAQVNTPLVGLVRGKAIFSTVYNRMTTSTVQTKTVLDDIILYFAPGLAVFTERERATSTQNRDGNTVTEELSGRSICIFRYRIELGGWRLIYHQISLDAQDRATQLQRDVPGG
jgi:hypothetical protein